MAAASETKLRCTRFNLTQSIDGANTVLCTNTHVTLYFRGDIAHVLAPDGSKANCPLTGFACEGGPY